MSKMIYALFLFVGTIISVVSGNDRFYKTEGDLSSEELKDVIKNDLQEKLMRYFPLANDDLAEIVYQNLNLTLDNIFDASAIIQDFNSENEGHQSKIDQAEQAKHDLSSFMANFTSYISDNNMSDQYDATRQNYIKALQEPHDVKKPIIQKLERRKKLLIEKAKRVLKLEREKALIINNLRVRKNLSKLSIFDSRLTSETVPFEFAAEQFDSIQKLKFYGSNQYGMTGIEVFLESGKTFICGTKEQKYFSEMTQSEYLSKLGVQIIDNCIIERIDFNNINGQQQTTGLFYDLGNWKEYQIQPDERLVGCSGSYFKSKYTKRFKQLNLIFERYDYY